MEIENSGTLGRFDEVENFISKNGDKWLDKLVDEYGESGLHRVSDTIKFHLPIVLSYLSISNPKIPVNDLVAKKKILDLGCGATEPTDFKENKRAHEPWLCRVLYGIGAHPIGIDIGDLSKEKFENYSLDLMKLNSLKFLKKHSIDLAHERLFINPLGTSPTLMDKYPQKIRFKRIDELIKQLHRIVKPEGYLVHNES